MRHDLHGFLPRAVRGLRERGGVNVPNSNGMTPGMMMTLASYHCSHKFWGLYFLMQLWWPCCNSSCRQCFLWTILATTNFDKHTMVWCVQQKIQESQTLLVQATNLSRLRFDWCSDSYRICFSVGNESTCVRSFPMKLTLSFTMFFFLTRKRLMFEEPYEALWRPSEICV